MSSNATAPSSSSSLFFIGNNTGGKLIALLEVGLGGSGGLDDGFGFACGLDDGLGTVEDGGLDDGLGFCFSSTTCSWGSGYAIVSAESFLFSKILQSIFCWSK